MDNSIKVIYIAGEVRSGTTILDLLLSNHKNVTTLGELSNLEDYLNRKGIGRTSNWECSCGRPVTDCLFWKNITSTFESQFKKQIRTKAQKAKGKCANQNAAKNCHRIFSIAARKTGATVLIDSSKTALQLKYLIDNPIGNTEIFVAFIIRDSRGVALSKNNWDTKFNRGKRGGLIKNILVWLKNNIAILSVICRYDRKKVIFFHYEDFVLDPSRYINEIYTMVGLCNRDAPDLLLNIQGKHNIAGTPNRKKFNNTPIKFDKRWVKKINTSSKILANYIGQVCNILFKKLSFLLLNKK